MTLGLTSRHPGDLPAEASDFVGRRRELEMLVRMLRSARLVTLTGPAGVGKTRLALRAAAAARQQFADGVCLVQLGGLRDPRLLPDTVAACLGLPESDARSGADAVTDYLHGRRLLLVLDTCEHMLDACEALCAALLSEAPGVTVLATSRQALDIPGEQGFPVPPLPVPAPDASAAGLGDAVELFARRAAAAVPGFAVTPANRGDVTRLCRRLEGIPLAIELAAVRLRATSLRALAGSLEHRFLLLSGGGAGTLPHQQTLRATTQWSHDLCTPAEQLLWARLSVFAGPFGIAAAEEVCAADPLGRADVLPALIGLVDKSVVLRAADGTRYRLLDTIREFGAAKLAESGAAAATRDRHIACFLARAADFADHAKDTDQLPRFRELRRDHADIRAALGYALGPPRTQEGDRRAARLATDLRPYWEISGLLREGRHWLTTILATFANPSAERARLLLTRGVLATFLGEHQSAIADLEASTVLGRDHGDELTSALGYAYLCLALAFSGAHAEAATAGAAAGERLRKAGHFGGLVSLDIHMGYLHLLRGEAGPAIEHCGQGLRRLGDGGERWARGYLHVITATALFLEGKTQASAAAARQALQLKHELGDTPGTAYCLEALALLAAGQHQCERAAWLLGAASALWERTGRPLGGNAALKELHSHAESTARDRLGSRHYAKLFRDGAVCDLDVTVSRAISEADGLRLGPRGHGPLTRREREIAGLAAVGRTDSQIADQLAISPRTVGAHLTHVYAKLGISARSQLAAWFAGRGRDAPAPPTTLAVSDQEAVSGHENVSDHGAVGDHGNVSDHENVRGGHAPPVRNSRHGRRSEVSSSDSTTIGVHRALHEALNSAREARRHLDEGEATPDLDDLAELGILLAALSEAVMTVNSTMLTKARQAAAAG
jgi:predicted ATPase/DNA-binding CsgD family transcriptional regulator